MAYTLVGWTSDTATILIGTLPLHTYGEVTTLVTSYLASVGGWVPVSASDPVGNGLPADSSTPAIAAALMLTAQLDKIHHVTTTTTIDVILDVVVNTTAGQSDTDILNQVKTTIDRTISEQLASTSMKLSTVNNVSGTVTTGGEITTTQRLAIDALITQNLYNDDPRAVGVYEARRIYALDATWSAQSFYTNDGSVVAVTIKKYTDDSLLTLDSTATDQYIISIQSNGYTTIGGTTIPA